MHIMLALSVSEWYLSNNPPFYSGLLSDCLSSVPTSDTVFPRHRGPTKTAPAVIMVNTVF